mmetsp:Transcript_70891/g.132610  ORF Transcript_70891/g.132610 Transcript_70891/m.132610 type:complete len:283 (-) Transcript_70891:1615-2463(-)
MVKASLQNGLSNSKAQSFMRVGKDTPIVPSGMVVQSPSLLELADEPQHLCVLTVLMLLGSLQPPLESWKAAHALQECTTSHCNEVAHGACSVRKWVLLVDAKHHSPSYVATRLHEGDFDVFLPRLHDAPVQYHKLFLEQRTFLYNPLLRHRNSLLHLREQEGDESSLSVVKEVELHDPRVHSVLQVMKAGRAENSHLLWKRLEHLPNSRFSQLRNHAHALRLYSGFPSALVQTEERQFSEQCTWVIILDNNVVLSRLRLAAHENEALMANAAFSNNHFPWQE